MSAASSSQPNAADKKSADPLTEAFARYQSELLGTLFYLVGNLEDAQDALQEAFIKCWKHRESLDSVENLKAWIFQIALNTGRDIRGTAWRRRRQALPADDTDLVAHQLGPEAQLQKREELQRLRAAIAELRPEEQEVFLLRQNGDLTYEQIAETTQTPIGTVKTRMRMALGKLRAVLGEAATDAT